MITLTVTLSILLILVLSGGAAVAVYLHSKKGSTAIPPRGDLGKAIAAGVGIVTAVGVLVGIALVVSQASPPGPANVGPSVTCSALSSRC
ncbi:hypothetical protein ACGFWD_40230 [Streptomyces sp. NPDC048448]|uniref:hypothetical protein n=1 Tax=unclassified Streptomyces TaxID=2593676 RepID=UPI00225AE9F2|nr:MULTISPECIES: hypothetical protein [unclassified Streptomyces]MCX4581139.1 hypothetical protein [Streptomyces sp. NBC_01571]